jgi:hypothetical protein
VSAPRSSRREEGCLRKKTPPNMAELLAKISNCPKSMKRRQKTTIMKKHALHQWQSEFDVQAEVSLVLKFPNVSPRSAFCKTAGSTGIRIAAPTHRSRSPQWSGCLRIPARVFLTYKLFKSEEYAQWPLFSNFFRTDLISRGTKRRKSLLETSLKQFDRCHTPSIRSESVLFRNTLRASFSIH